MRELTDGENDMDSDKICGNIDSCPFDSKNDVDSDRVCTYEVCRDIPNFMSSVGSCKTYAKGRVNNGKCLADGVCDECACSCKYECSDACPNDNKNDATTANITAALMDSS